MEYNVRPGENETPTFACEFKRCKEIVNQLANAFSFVRPVAGLTAGSPGPPAAVPWISCLPRPSDGPTIQSYSLQTQSPALKPAWHAHVWLYCCTGLVAHRDVASRCSVSLISAILSLGRQTGHEEKVGRRESSKAPPACSAHQHHVFPFCCKICNEYLPGFVVGTANQQNMQIPLFQVIFFILLHL